MVFFDKVRDAVASVKASLVAALFFVSDTRWRRAVATAIVVALIHFFGVALDVDQVDILLTLALPLAAAWTHKQSEPEAPVDNA